MDWKERTKVILTKKKISQAELSRRIGVTKAAVSTWLSDKVELTDKNTLKLQYQIAGILEVTPEYLISGVSPDEPMGRSVPLLKGFQAIHDWMTSGVAPDSAPWHTCPVDCGERSYCFVPEQGSSMNSSEQQTPGIPDNTLVFIDPEEPAAYNKCCLFQDQSPMLGIYEEVNGKSLLIFYNQRFKAIEVTKDNYLGRAIGFFQRL